MYKLIFLLSFLYISGPGIAQSSYKDSLQQFIEEYIQKHEVVKGADRGKLSFYKIDSTYRITGRFERKENSTWFLMATSGSIKKLYRIFGVVHFTINGQPESLNIYQSQDLLQNPTYKDYLFLPFTDETNGHETYEGGRYIDLRLEDIHNHSVAIDFNKSYNPYCAYVTGRFSCPIPPKENQLNVAVKAGEKAFPH